MGISVPPIFASTTTSRWDIVWWWWATQQEFIGGGWQQQWVVQKCPSPSLPRLMPPAGLPIKVEKVTVVEVGWQTLQLGDILPHPHYAPSVSFRWHAYQKSEQAGGSGDKSVYVWGGNGTPMKGLLRPPAAGSPSWATPGFLLLFKEKGATHICIGVYMCKYVYIRTYVHAHTHKETIMKIN